MAKKKTKPAAPRYSWDGGPKKHSIPQQTHAQNVDAAKYGIDLNAPASQPLDNRGAYGIAQAAAGRVYDPQIQAATQMQANVQPWFQDYINRSIKSQQANQAYAAQVLAPAQAWANAPAQAAPGLDPNSAAYGASQQAAQSGQGLAQLGYTTLAAIPVAANSYMAGQQDIAARQIPAAQAAYGTQIGQLKGQKGQAVADEYGKARTAEQNAQIAYTTLAGDQANMAADNKQNAANADQAKKDKKAARVVSRKNTRDRITASTEKQTAAANTKAAKEKAAADKEAAKKHETIQKATGEIKTKITDAQTAWERYARVRNPVIDPVTKKQTGEIKATPDQIKSQLRKDGYTETEIHIMLMLRGGKTLTADDVKRLKGQDPNIRIPREWLAGKSTDPKPTSGQQNGLGGK